MPNLIVEEVSIENKSILEKYFQFYLYEHSIFTDDAPINGKFPYKYLNTYWKEKERTPYWLKVDGEIAGFALIRQPKNKPKAHEVSEFFIINRFRNKGYGKFLMSEIFKLIAGRWVINQVKNNPIAIKFWRATIKELAGEYKENSVIIDNIERFQQEFTVG